MQKIQPCKFREFCILLYYAQKFAPLLSRKWCKLLHAIQKYTKFAKFAELYFPHFTTVTVQMVPRYACVGHEKDWWTSSLVTYGPGGGAQPLSPLRSGTNIAFFRCR